MSQTGTMTMLFFIASLFLCPARNLVNARTHITKDQNLTIAKPQNQLRLEDQQAIVIKPKVVNGVEVFPKFKYEFMVVSLDGCGASLVAPNVLLSTAHCFENFDSVQIGRHNLLDDSEDYETFNIVEKVTHPNFDDISFNNDFMVLRLDGNSTRTPVELDTGDVPLDSGRDVVVMGWGTTSSGGVVSNILLEAEIDLYSQAECQDKYNGMYWIRPSMVCAARPGKDTCQGDSGGPMIDKLTGKQIGVVSWGIDCASPDYPGVYSKVQDQISWIQGYIDYWSNGLISSPAPTPAPSPDCVEDTSWRDSLGFFCDFYELVDTPGCPVYGNLYDGGMGTAGEACCHCGGGSAVNGTGPFPTPAPTIPCFDDASWLDIYGDSCDWYEVNDLIGCPTYGAISDWIGTTANEACCHCGGGEPEFCSNYDSWIDTFGDSCNWYVINDAEGCPQHGDTENVEGVTATEACCHCGGGNTGAPTPAPTVTAGCINVLGWTDTCGHDCSFYEESETCLFDTICAGGSDMGPLGEACCYCGGGTADNVVTPFPTPSPTTTADSGIGGDPHYLPFRAPPFSYHGQCDSIMIASNSFASGLGIRVHIRTTRVDNQHISYSYISSTAMKIGREVLEVQDNGSLLMNGNDFLVDENENESSGMYAGFVITKTFKGKRKNISVYNLDLERGRSIEIRFNAKTGMIFVDVKGTFPFDTVGLLGSPHHDRLLARDGMTDLTGQWNTFGEEWQVTIDEPKLFQYKDHFPQHPAGCVYKATTKNTKSRLRRRLLLDGDNDADEESFALVSAEEAQNACAHSTGVKKQYCIDDVMATNDIELAMDAFYS